MKQINLAIASPSPSAYSETFIRMQMECLPCVLRIHGGPVADETIPGGPILPLRNARGMIETLYHRGVKHRDAGGPQTSELKRRLIRHKIEIVLANFGPTGVALRSLCRDLGIPLVVHFHGYDAHRSATVAEYQDEYRKLAQDASAIIVVSRVMARALEQLGFPRDKLHLTRYGVAPERFQRDGTEPPSRAPFFFGVGRFVDKKAPYLTVLAFSEVHKRHPAARLILAGDGVLLDATKNIAKAIGLEHAVEFPGVLAPREVATYMRSATAFVQHSITPESGPSAGDSEGTPVALLEAMLSGLPVISTRHAGIAEVIDHEKTGLLVRERDVQGMGAAMIAVLESPDLASELGGAARREAAAKYTSVQYLGSLNRILRRAVERGWEKS